MKSMYDVIHRSFFESSSSARVDGSKTSASDNAIPAIADLLLSISLALAQLNKTKKEEHLNGADE